MAPLLTPNLSPALPSMTWSAGSGGTQAIIKESQIKSNPVALNWNIIKFTLSLSSIVIITSQLTVQPTVALTVISYNHNIPLGIKSISRQAIRG